MKILFYLHQFPAFGGIETVTARLSNVFASDGHQIRIVSFCSQKGSGILDGMASGVDWMALPSEQMDSKENVSALVSIIDAFVPDVIVFQDSYAPVEGVLMAAIKESAIRPKLIVVEHNRPIIWRRYKKFRWTCRELCVRVLYPYFFVKSFWAALIRRNSLCRFVDAYVTLSPRYSRRAVRLTPFYFSKYTSIANPFSRSSMVNGRRNNTILYVGTLIKRKGVDRLLDVWKEFVKNHNDWAFQIVGDGPMRETLCWKCIKERIPNVEFLGARTDVEWFCQRAKIFVMASDVEGWPMTLGEAMGAGCVPIATDSFEAVRDIIEDGYDGFVVRHFDLMSFVQKLEYIAANDSVRGGVSARAIDKAKRFYIESIKHEWYRLFNKLTGGCL